MVRDLVKLFTTGDINKSLPQSTLVWGGAAAASNPKPKKPRRADLSLLTGIKATSSQFQHRDPTSTPKVTRKCHTPAIWITSALPAPSTQNPYSIGSGSLTVLTVGRIQGDGPVVIGHSHTCAHSQRDLVACCMCGGNRSNIEVSEKP